VSLQDRLTSLRRNERWIVLIGLALLAAAVALALIAGAPRWTVAAAGLIGAAAILAAIWRRSGERSAPTAASVSQGAPLAETAPFAEILERLPDPILVVAGGKAEDLTSRRFVYANAAARELFFIQRPGGPLTTAVRAPEVLEAADEALYGRASGSAVYEPGGAQGRVWRARATPLRPASEGGPALALLTFRDETEVRRAEQTRADFLANASHELRTPLASLSGFIETLRGHARDDAGAREKFLSIMHLQARRMSRLIDDLMSLSRIELNEHVPPAGEVDLALAIADALDALAPQAGERGVTFRVVAPPSGPSIVGDRDQVLQVIQNLAENALKYSPRGGEVVVELTQGLSAADAAHPRSERASHMSLLTPDHAGGQTYAVLRIQDSGPGLAREHLPRLTQRFYRVEGQKSGERSGTGLGLAIVKHILNRHRGGLCVESVEGEGATFTAFFPSRPVA